MLKELKPNIKFYNLIFLLFYKKPDAPLIDITTVDLILVYLKR